MRVRRGGETVSLSPTEFKLLRFLMRHREQVVSKAQILDHVWEYDFDGNASVVENYISYLRKKLDDARRQADPHRARVRVRVAHRRLRVTP